MPNVEQIIKTHNVKVLNEEKTETRECNCRRKNECPLDGKCLISCIVYKAEVTCVEGKRVYYGSCMGPFKERYRNHKKSFNNRTYSEETKLSKFVWELKDKNEQYEIAWSVVKKCVPYRPSATKCDLCLSEKLCIIKGKPDRTINKGR